MAETRVTVKLEGVQQAVAALTRIERSARRRAVSAGVRAGNKILRTRARSEAPAKTGALRKSINASVNMDQATGTVIGTIYAGKATKAMTKRGQTAYYAHMVHGGTRPHAINRRVKIGGTYTYVSQHPGARPNPFMERAMTASAQQAIAAFTTAFGAKVEEEVSLR
jgi:HK97 gp10 family phage protein